MKIGIEIKKSAYMPEALAYKSYLEEKGHTVRMSSANDMDIDNDINIFFMGFIPFWKKTKPNSKIIHEYASLSTPPLARIKDIIKKKFGQKPDGRIFTELSIRDGLNFQDGIPYILRNVGVEAALFSRENLNIQYDIVYCGSIIGRPKLIDKINHLCDLGFSMAVIGNLGVKEKSALTHNNIFLAGKLDRVSIKKIYNSSRFGLNYTPDIHPLNQQVSIKTLEYFASGLPVIANKYAWISNFAKNNPTCTIVWLDEISYPPAKYPASRLSKNYCWDFILNKSELGFFLNSLTQSSRQ